MYFTPLSLLLVVLTASPPENPVFTELTEKGITMSDGTLVKLPPPILADGLDAAAQKAAIEKIDTRNAYDDLVKKSYYSPVAVKVRTIKEAKGEGPSIRSLDTWFVVHGDWKTLTSKDFFDSLLKPKDDGKSRVVSKSGILTEQEMAARKLTAVVKESYEERFVYSTFSLFERVEISATRFAVLSSGKDWVLAAARVDPRFDKDADFPNQWRPLLRDERAEIKAGPANPFAHAGGYAKITRLVEPADAVFLECHLVYEEPYGWFNGINLVKQKAGVMVGEKVKIFRRKLALAGKEKE